MSSNKKTPTASSSARASNSASAANQSAMSPSSAWRLSREAFMSYLYHNWYIALKTACTEAGLPIPSTDASEAVNPNANDAEARSDSPLQAPPRSPAPKGFESPRPRPRELSVVAQAAGIGICIAQEPNESKVDQSSAARSPAPRAAVSSSSTRRLSQASESSDDDDERRSDEPSDSASQSSTATLKMTLHSFRHSRGNEEQHRQQDRFYATELHETNIISSRTRHGGGGGGGGGKGKGNKNKSVDARRSARQDEEESDDNNDNQMTSGTTRVSVAKTPAAQMTSAATPRVRASTGNSRQTQAQMCRTAPLAVTTAQRGRQNRSSNNASNHRENEAAASASAGARQLRSDSRHRLSAFSYVPLEEAMAASRCALLRHSDLSALPGSVLEQCKLLWMVQLAQQRLGRDFVHRKAFDQAQYQQDEFRAQQQDCRANEVTSHCSCADCLSFQAILGACVPFSFAVSELFHSGDTPQAAVYEVRSMAHSVRLFTPPSRPAYTLCSISKIRRGQFIGVYTGLYKLEAMAQKEYVENSQLTESEQTTHDSSADHSASASEAGRKMSTRDELCLAQRQAAAQQQADEANAAAKRQAKSTLNSAASSGAAAACDQSSDSPHASSGLPLAPMAGCEAKMSVVAPCCNGRTKCRCAGQCFVLSPCLDEWHYSGPKLTIDSWRQGNATRFINDVCFRRGSSQGRLAYTDTQNATFFTTIFKSQPVVLVQALRDINRGEELILDYGSVYWNVAQLRLVYEHQQYQLKAEKLCFAIQRTLEKAGVKLPPEPEDLCDGPAHLSLTERLALRVYERTEYPKELHDSLFEPAQESFSQSEQEDDESVQQSQSEREEAKQQPRQEWTMELE